MVVKSLKIIITLLLIYSSYYMWKSHNEFQLLNQKVSYYKEKEKLYLNVQDACEKDKESIKKIKFHYRISANNLNNHLWAKIYQKEPVKLSLNICN